MDDIQPKDTRPAARPLRDDNVVTPRRPVPAKAVTGRSLKAESKRRGNIGCLALFLAITILLVAGIVGSQPKRPDEYAGYCEGKYVAGSSDFEFCVHLRKVSNGETSINP